MKLTYLGAAMDPEGRVVLRLGEPDDPVVFVLPDRAGLLHLADAARTAYDQLAEFDATDPVIDPRPAKSLPGNGDRWSLNPPEDR